MIADEDTVRLEYLGTNNGPIPFKGPSGKVYKVAKRTYRFIEALESDVDFMVRSRKFRLAKPVVKETQVFVEEKAAELPPVEATAEVGGENVETLPSDPVVLNTNTVKELDHSLSNGEFELEELQLALMVEEDKDKPRQGVLDRLTKVIEKHPDYQA